MRQTIAYGVAAQQGNWPAQEDGFFVDPQSRVFALADGFGGKGNGDLAAKLVLKELGARVPRMAEAKLSGTSVQLAFFKDINKIILDWNGKRAPAKRGGSSLALVQVSTSGLVTMMNCGASAVVLVRNSASQALLSPQSAPRFHSGGALYPTQAIGMGAEISPEFRVFQALPGDLLFLASSGLEWESVGFQVELLAQWGIHLPGSDLNALARDLVGRVSPEWNATFLGLEIP
jgi:serine/threonine protein phosphatase PrpC